MNKFYYPLIVFLLVCSSDLCSQNYAFLSDVDINKQEVSSVDFNMLNDLRTDGLEGANYMTAQNISTFKKNRRIINYTALGLFASGVTIGLLYTLDCNRKAFGDHQCQLGIVLGSVFGGAAGLLTLAIGHPINRIRNKKNDHSNFETKPSSQGDIVLNIGVINSGIGFSVDF